LNPVVGPIRQPRRWRVGLADGARELPSVGLQNPVIVHDRYNEQPTDRLPDQVQAVERLDASSTVVGADGRVLTRPDDHETGFS
jgi:hypothetical protein